MKRAAVWIVSSLACIGAASCSGIAGPDTERFAVRVDSIVAAPRLGLLDPVRVVLHGRIGPDGCHALDRIDESRNGSSAELTVWGRRSTGRDIACTQVVVELHGEYVFSLPTPDPFTVLVRQPDGAFLEKTVRIE